MAIMIPSHTGSSPMASRMGATMGTTTKVISMKSRMKPSRNINSITRIMAVTTPPGMSPRKSRTRSSPPKPRKTSENSAAPMKITNTMAVTRVVDSATSRNTASLSLSWRPRRRKPAAIKPSARPASSRKTCTAPSGPVQPASAASHSRRPAKKG